MYTLNIDRAIKKMTPNKIRDFIYYKRIEFSKESSYYSIKCLKKKYLLLLLKNKLIEKYLILVILLSSSK